MVDVVITGIGVVLPGCRDRKTFWSQLSGGEPQLRLEGGPQGTRRAVGRIPSFVPTLLSAEVSAPYLRRYTRDQLFYLESLLLARDDAGLALDAIDPERVAIFDGTSRGPLAAFAEHDAWTLALTPGMAVGYAASMLGVRGPTYTLHGTCASGALAAGLGLREIETGEVDVALVTGHDAPLAESLFSWYEGAGLHSRESENAARAVRPYGGDSGNAFGEGAVTLVLESRAHATARGAKVLARMAGYACGNGGAHPTQPDPEGQRGARLLTQLLERARLPRERVHFVVGHGNGVPLSDRSELAGLRRFFGTRTAEIPILSTKPIYGHTLGASAMVSLGAAALMVHERVVAPMVNVARRSLPSEFMHLPVASAATGPINGIVVAYGMGGQHAALAVCDAREAA